ncbi:MAG: phosphomannomutase/phosphoglucomutase [Thermoanaerobacteraceae bacterium]|nr:phosphomannomutase/phosphoglucomutase [Thermoanaerobacteraceae bacterium]
MAKINPTIFRQYDIRGTVSEELNKDTAYLIGKAFGTYLKRNDENMCLVGHDNRASSLDLMDAAIEGLLSTGADVLIIGLATTPMFYYSRILYNVNPGLMITASHNPPQYNGFKVCFGPATLYGEDLQGICRMIENDDFIESPRGEVSYAYPIFGYADMLEKKIKLDKQLKVVVDCGNGTTSVVGPQVLDLWGCDVVPIYSESDPNFPNHFPDPVKEENLKDLKDMVLKTGADLGIGFDGDGDRIGVVDDKGNIIWGDTMMALFWREILPKYPGIDCIVEVKCSEALADEIKRLGGQPFFYKTGHSLIKAKMRQLNSPFTGEMSGHMFFADEYFGFDDALYAAGRLLRILSKSGRRLSELLSDVPFYVSTPEIRAESNDKEKFNIVENAKRYFVEKGCPVVDIDGVRAYIYDGWCLARASNTGPEVILRAEAKTEEGLEKILDELRKAVPLKF